MNKLPIWKTWTIDLRLKQFRRVGRDGIEFVDFDSDDGKKLMIEYCEEQKEYYQELADDYQDDYQRMIFDLERDDTDEDTLESIAEEMGQEED